MIVAQFPFLVGATISKSFLKGQSVDQMRQVNFPSLSRGAYGHLFTRIWLMAEPSRFLLTQHFLLHFCFLKRQKWKCCEGTNL